MNLRIKKFKNNEKKILSKLIKPFELILRAILTRLEIKKAIRSNASKEIRHIQQNQQDPKKMI